MWLCTAKRSAGWRESLKTSREWYWDKSRYGGSETNSPKPKHDQFVIITFISWGYRIYERKCYLFDPQPIQVLDQATQAQATLRDTTNRLTRDMQNHLISIKLLNQSLERYLDRVEGWKDVIEETEEKMKTLTEDQYDVKATAQQVNTTVALRWMKN